MLISLIVATYTLGLKQGKKMGALADIYGHAVKDVSLILLIVAGSGAFKAVLTDSGANHQIGAARITQALAAAYGPAPIKDGELFDHILMSTVVTIGADGRSASARSTQVGQFGRNGEWARWELGTYDNDFVRQDGVWKLKTVRYVPTFAADYDKGWAQ